MKAINCRDFDRDCNAVMKGRNLDEAVDATIKHFVAMHGMDAKKLQAAESRTEIGAKASDFEPPVKRTGW